VSLPSPHRQDEQHDADLVCVQEQDERGLDEETASHALPAPPRPGVPRACNEHAYCYCLSPSEVLATYAGVTSLEASSAGFVRHCLDGPVGHPG
jgi:hypothetical protein